MITNRRYNLQSFSQNKLWSSSMLKHPKLYNQTFSYLCQYNFISNPNQMHSKHFYSSYQIINGV